MNIIITGATSFIGINLIEELKKKGHIIYAVVRPNSPNRDKLPIAPNIIVIELEMSEYDRIPECIKQADVLYHLSWQGVRGSQRDDKELQKLNYFYSLKAMETARKIGVKVFIGMGSQAEYGITKGLVDETVPCNPVTAYGKEKMRACVALKEMAEEYEIRFAWVRIFSLYGPGDSPNTLVMTCMEKMKKNMLIEMTECTHIWDFLHVKDAARALCLFCEREYVNGIYNLASGIRKPLRDYVEIIKKTLHSKSEICYGAIPYGNAGPVNLEPDIRKIITTFEWEPTISFEEGISHMNEEEEKNL